MVLGDHGRKILHPMTPFQRVALFPYGKLYKQSMYFRAICRVGVAVAAGWIYVIGYKGIDPWFTPYDAVHHKISHTFAHSLEEKRYPPKIEHNSKH